MPPSPLIPTVPTKTRLESSIQKYNPYFIYDRLFPGPPEWDLFASGQPWTREPRLLVNSYSRLTLVSPSTLMFEQVANDNGTVVDSFTITQTRPIRSAPFPCFYDQETH